MLGREDRSWDTRHGNYVADFSPGAAAQQELFVVVAVSELRHGGHRDLTLPPLSM